MKPPLFSYIRPGTLKEAVEAIAATNETDEEVRILAGGQSLIPLLNFRLAYPTVLVDLNIVDELSLISTQDDWLVLGSMVRLRHAEISEEVIDACPLLIAALRHVGHLQIRNRGTIGGSIAHADPAAELPALVLCLGAQIVAVSTRGQRVIEAPDIFLGPFTTTLAADEMVTEIRFPKTTSSKTAFVEFSRRHGDFAIAGVGVAVAFEQDGKTVHEARFGALGVGSTPVRLTGAEEAIQGKELTDSIIKESAEIASLEVEPLDDIHADAEYRRELLANLVWRSLREVGA